MAKKVETRANEDHEQTHVQTMGEQLNMKKRLIILSRRDRMGRAKPTWYRIFAVIIILATIMFVFNLIQTKSWESHNVVATAVADNEVQFTFIGDVCLGRHVETYGKENGFSSLFKDSSALWANSKCVFANLECAVLSEEKSYKENKDKPIHISASETALHAAAEAGITAVSVANNHVADYQKKGLKDTLKAVKACGLTYAGSGENIEAASEVRYIDADGITVAFLAFSDVIPKGFSVGDDSYGILTVNNAELYKNVLIANDNADFVVVYVHWGVENAVSIEDTQQSIGRQLIESGADIVIGTHPHVLQNIELYKDGIIYYSLGNFIFDQGTRDSRNTVMVQLNVNKDTGEGEFTLIPMRINNFHPYVTESKFYVSQIQRTLTASLQDWQYTVTEDGRIHIPLQIFSPK